MDKQIAFAQFKAAVIALTNCWDSLRELEIELGTEVETDDIQGFAGDDDWTEEAFERFLSEIKERDSE